MVWYDNWPVWHKYDIFLIHNVIPRSESLSKNVSKSKKFWFGEVVLSKPPRCKKNYLFWTDRTDFKEKINVPLNNAYFAILSQNQKCPQKCLQLRSLVTCRRTSGTLNASRDLMWLFITNWNIFANGVALFAPVW